MAIFKCKMCGGTLEITEGTSVGTCEFCGTQQTIPTVTDEALQVLFNRANVLRMKSEFDKAAEVYEKILQKNDKEAEAYWGLILCKYGIEYVEDPATFKRIPTCHRASYDAVTADEDYKNALANADSIQRGVYEAEAKAIDEIQKGIIALAQKEDPYDVFICYKETDENGKRTQDSVIANDIYHQLTMEGFKVFYAAITLEDKLGKEYEPYIFSALNTAKVMLSLGTKPENFNAVWVKNEWSRFLKIMKKDRSKLLIPCYRDMDAYELPEEFAHLQAQDMSKIGFINDIVRGIKKVIVKGTAQTQAQETVVAQSAAQANTLPLLERAFLFLEDSKWQDANIYCEKVLDIDPKNAEAYLGKLMAELHVEKRGQLEDCEKPFDDRDNYSKVIRFGDETLENEMRAYIERINERNERSRLVNIYNSAVDTMQKADSEEKYKAAEEAFRSIAGFKDSDALAEECAQKAQVCHLEAERKAEEKRIAAEKAAKKRKRIIAIAAPIVCVCVAFAIVWTTVIIPNNKYKAAMALVNEGKYEEAISAFEAMEGYKDSTEKITEVYNSAGYKAKKINGANVGDIVLFGAYEQDNDTSNGKENIEWLLLEKSDGKALVISKYALDCQKYNSTGADATWETSSLRAWLNLQFMDNAFATDEQTIIMTTTVSADGNTKYRTNAGNATSDKVFLLSIKETERYFGKASAGRRCKPTAYAKARGADTDKDGYCWWWLRSPGSWQNRAASVSATGSVKYGGEDVISNGIVVRPAMWINLNA